VTPSIRDHQVDTIDQRLLRGTVGRTRPSPAGTALGPRGRGAADEVADVARLDHESAAVFMETILLDSRVVRVTSSFTAQPCARHGHPV
jgi:hypothetical protein